MELQRTLAAAVFADVPDTAQIDQLRASIAEAEAAALAKRVDLQLKIAHSYAGTAAARARMDPSPPQTTKPSGRSR